MYETIQEYEYMAIILMISKLNPFLANNNFMISWLVICP